jgi:fatty-acyl-CoA synthase
MTGFAIVPEKLVSRVRGIPLAQEPGLGSLTLPGWLREVTARFGAREALVQTRPGGMVERWSYDDLWERSMQVARALAACGIGKGARVGILMTNRAEFVAAFFGTALAGGVATPLSTFCTRNELDDLLAASSCSVLIVEPRVLKKDFINILAELDPRINTARRCGVGSLRYPFLQYVVSLDIDAPECGFEPWGDFLGRGDAVSSQRVEARAACVASTDPGALFFSSGTTGKPKGILNAHRGMAIQLWRWPRIFGLEEDVRCWVANGFFWSAPFAMGVGGALSRGGTLVLQSSFQPEESLALMAAERVNCPMGWPHQWAQLAAAANWNSVDLSAMRYVAPENPLSRHPSVKVDWAEPTRIYGNTETFTLSTGYCAGTPEEVLKGAHGFPLPGMTVKIVDPVTGQILPMGEHGELAIKGPTLMLGYVGTPLDETLDEEGFFRTGDSAYVDEEGRVYWQGRLNDIIKTGGANVSPIEVDHVLMQCPGVKWVRTVGVPDELLGELVVACVVPQRDALLDESAIRKFAKDRLASYKVPRRALFLSEADFAQTASAKVKLAELRTNIAGKLACTEPAR